MTERIQEVIKLARNVAEGSIVQQATDRLIYQIVEVCAEHEREAIAELVEALGQALDDMGEDGHCVCEATKLKCLAVLKQAGEK